MQITLAWYNVSDLAAAKHFYAGVLGLKQTFEMPGWAEFSHSEGGSPSIGLAEGQPGGPGGATVVLTVPNLDAEMDKLRAAGVEFCGPVQEIPGVVRLAMFADGSGNRLQLAESLLPS